MTTVKAPPSRPLAHFGAAILKTPPAASRVLIVVAVATVVVEFLGNSLGLWWITLLAGIAVGLLRQRGAITGLVVGTLVAWGIGIIVQAGGQTAGIAGVVSALAFNARGLGWLILVLTFVYALLLALSGAWLGAAARRISSGRHAADGPPPALQPVTPTNMKETGNV